MRCPFCNHADTLVHDSRPSEDRATVKRRRNCPKCKGRFMTLERIGTRSIKVVKHNGNVRLFDGNKIIRSMELAARKRPITYERLEEALGSIILKLEQSGDVEVSTKKIGQMVMAELSKIDPIAYIRYASVYKNFKEVDDFGKFIEHFKVEPDA